jgi:hypothetical protein
MPVTPVSARIDVMVNGQNNLDRLATTYRNLDQMANRARTTVMSWDKAHGSMIRSTTSLAGAVGQLVNRMQQNAAAWNSGNTAIQRFHGNVLALTKSMLVFGTVLPLVNQVLPSTFIGRLQDAVEVGKEWEYGIRSIKSLIGDMGEKDIPAFDQSLQHLGTQWGLQTSELKGVREIYSSLTAFQKDFNSGQTDTARGLQITTNVIKFARAGFAELGDALEAVTTAVAAGSFENKDIPTLMEHMAETINVGRISLQQFNKDAPTFLAFMQGTLDLADTGEERMRRFAGAMQLFAAASQDLSSTRAATGLANIFRDIGRGQRGQGQVVAEMEKLRKAGTTNIDIRGTSLRQLGPLEQIQALGSALGTTSPLVDKYIAQRRKMGQLDNEAAARAQISAGLIEKYFDESRAIKVFNTLVSNQGDLLRRTVHDYEADIAQGQVVERMAADWEATMQATDDRLDAAIRNFKLGIFSSIAPGLKAMKDAVINNLSVLVDSGEWQRADIFGKIEMGARSLLKQFADWYDTGGKGEVKNLGYRLARSMGDALSAAFKGGERGSIMRAATDFAEAFAAGVKDSLPQALMSVLGGAAGQGILSYLLFRQFGLGRGASGAGALGMVSALQGNAGIGGQVAAGGLGVVGLGILGAAALKGVGGARVPLVGGTYSGFIGGLGKSAAQRAAEADIAAGIESGAIQTGAQLGMGFGKSRLYNMVTPFTYPGGPGTAAVPGTPIRGSYIGNAETMMPGFGGRQVLRWLGNSPVARAGRGTYMRAGGALGLGLTALNVLTAPEDQRGRAIAEGIGGIAGGALGSFLGPLGMLAGGAGGSLLGGLAYDQFFGPKGQPITGGGAGDQQMAQGIQGMIFALDNSAMTDILMQIRNLLSRNGGGAGGLGTIKRGGTGGIPGPAGGGAGDLTRFETSQFGDRQLSDAEALAACGPAAAVFFAKANGRNPTLKEALGIAKGLGWSTGAGMPSLQSEADLLTGLGVAGATVGSVDWSRIQNDAIAGRPSIVNVGKSGNFPGHFFQVSGYENGKFRVGKSGLALAGGSEWMTAAQIAAYGPLAGAVYSQAAGPPAPAGSGGHADFVRNMMPFAQATAAKLGVDPNWLIAMAASESNWGSTPGNALFGIKGTGTAGSVGLKTWELVNGQRVNTTANFAAYNNPQESFDAYANLLMNKYPGALNQRTLGGFVGGLKAGGYMTDTAQHYQSTLQGILNQFGGGAGGVPSDIVGSGRSIVINGNLIGTAMIGSNVDIRDLALQLVEALESLDQGGGDAVGQGEQITP